MTHTLPARADIDLLKKQAKKLLKQHRSGNADALTTVSNYHPKPESFSGLRDAQLAVARSYGFKGWAELSDAITNTPSDKAKLLYCNFCGKDQHEVRKLIAGPNVFICDQCADLCIGIIVEEHEELEEGEPDKTSVTNDMPNLKSVIQKSREFNIPKNKSKPKKNPADDARLSIPQIYENALDSGFSGVILARHRGDIVLHEASGFANKGQKILNTVDTVFDMGAITKQFTSALILSLQEAGLLKVEDTLKEHFANVPKDKADITIHQLLTHTAGFVHGIGIEAETTDREEFLGHAWAHRLKSGPGSNFMYSNVGYGIATAIAEKVTGQSYEAALNKNILEQALLKETGYHLPDWSRHTLANGYVNGRHVDKMRALVKDEPVWRLRGHDGLLTTASDLLKWHDAISGESVLTSSSIESMQSRHVDTSQGDDEATAVETFYGYGWAIQDKPSGVVHWHSGGNGYYSALISRHLSEDLVIIGLSNEGEGAVENLCKDLETTIVGAG